ncbi:MAG: type II toxin-antitoxin system RelE/ParE family toxin [Nitrospirae bacterium]|nr:type II toxin-antitoxin system RelE/ParE family toxin [Nitrospirota bacterium]
MPRTLVVFYKDREGNVPVLEWLDGLPVKIQDKCVVKIERLRELGHELRRPEADLLRNGVYELRVGREGMNYRILYFFHGRVAAVLAHGLTKEQEVPVKDIERVLERKRLFEQDPDGHTYREG